MRRERDQQGGGEGMRGVWIVVVVVLGRVVGRLHAEDIGGVSTTFRVLGAAAYSLPRRQGAYV